MNGNSILLGRAFGIPIRVQVLLLILLPVLAIWYSPNNLLFGLMLVVGVFASVALHELGHSVVAMRKGCHVQEIVLSPIGGAAKMSNIPSKPMDEFQIAVAGPLVSLCIGLLGINSAYPVLFLVGAINLFLFVFNLLPCFPMDGGRVLRAFLSHKKGRLEATRLAVKIGKYFCILFVVFGLIRFNLLLAFIGFYIYQAGQQEYRMVMMEHQASPFSGYRDGHMDVEVSPPPYSSAGGGFDSVKEKLRGLFRR
jgi:Zn-dependent protease